MKAAIVVLADTETHEALGRAVNAMVTALDFKESGDDVQLIFDGGGTRWPPVLGGTRSDAPRSQRHLNLI